MDTRNRKTQAIVAIAALAIFLVAIIARLTVHADSPSDPYPLCLIIAQNTADISTVNTTHVCLRENERLISTYSGEVVVLSWKKSGTSGVYVLSVKLMSKGGEPMWFNVVPGNVVRFPSLESYSITVAGASWQMADKYVTIEDV